MERLEDICEDCQHFKDDCHCYFLERTAKPRDVDWKFEYAFEQLTEKTSFFKKNSSSLYD